MYWKLEIIWFILLINTVWLIISQRLKLQSREKRRGKVDPDEDHQNYLSCKNPEISRIILKLHMNLEYHINYTKSPLEKLVFSKMWSSHENCWSLQNRNSEDAAAGESTAKIQSTQNHPKQLVSCFLRDLQNMILPGWINFCRPLAASEHSTQFSLLVSNRFIRRSSIHSEETTWDVWLSAEWKTFCIEKLFDADTDLWWTEDMSL